MKIFNFIAKLAITLVLLIMIEGLLTLGQAFDFANYNWLGYLVQICFVIMCARLSIENWDKWKN